LHDFDAANLDGQNPPAGVVLQGGELYGTTPCRGRRRAGLMRFWAKRSYRPFGADVRTVETWIIVACYRDTPGLLRGDLVLDDPSEPRAPFSEKCWDAMA
jgi:hypothetical protein